MNDRCAYELYPKTFYSPAEFCENDAEYGSEFCSDHDPDRYEPDWDQRLEDAYLSRWEPQDGYGPGDW